MKSRRALWAFVAVATLALAAAYWWRNQPPVPTAAHPAPIVVSPRPAAPVVAPPPAAASAANTTAAQLAATLPVVLEAAPPVKKAKLEVAIQDGKTIDFSSGVAVVKDDAKQKAVIDKAVAEMESALRSVTFAPAAPKTAEPTSAAPKP